jgi:hypothetical protein
MTVAAHAQTALDENVVEDEMLEQALEARERMKARARDARKAYAKANDAARAHLERHQLNTDVPLRVGRFVVTARDIDARSVSFETEPTTRITISTPKDRFR